MRMWEGIGVDMPEETAIAVMPKGGVIAPDVLALVQDQTVDAAKLHSLFDFQERLDKRNAEAAFNADFGELMQQMPTITKTGKIEIRKDGRLLQSTPYARYEDIDRAIRPLLNEFGFSLSFTSAPLDGGRLMITGTLRHRRGHSIQAAVPVSLDTSGSKNNSQGAGSTISYGKRYCVTMLLNLVAEGEDDDGNGGGNEPITEEQCLRIETLLSEQKGNPKALAKLYGVEMVSEIKAKDYEDALSRIMARRAELQKAGKL